MADKLTRPDFIGAHYFNVLLNFLKSAEIMIDLNKIKFPLTEFTQMAWQINIMYFAELTVLCLLRNFSKSFGIPITIWI